MKRKLLFVIFALCGLNAISQNACQGFHNPTSFSTMAGSAGYWSARVGDRVRGADMHGSTGYNVLSTCLRTNSPVLRNAQILSSDYYSGTCAYTDNTCHHTFFDANDHRFRILTAADAGLDQFTINNGVGMQRIPEGHTSSIRLGDMRSTGLAQTSVNSQGNNKGAEALYYTMEVNANNALLFIDYAVVARRYDHSPYEAGEFIIRVVGKTGDTWNNAPLTNNLWYVVPAPHYSGELPAPWVEGLPGPATGGTTCGYCYKPWTKVAISLLDYLYDSVRVEMYTSDCIFNVDPLYAYIAGSCQPMRIETSGCAAGDASAVDTLRAPEGLLNYVWYVSAYGFNGNTNNTAVMDTVTFRRISSTNNTNSVHVATLEDFVISQGPHLGDTVVEQTYKCVMTSALDPDKPFTSTLYTTVRNTKPVAAIEYTALCDGTVELHNRSYVPYIGEGAAHIQDSLIQWEIYNDQAQVGTPNVLVGSNVSYHYDSVGRYLVTLSIPTDDSACYTIKDFHIDSRLHPHTQVRVNNHTLCEGDTAILTDITLNIDGRTWVFEDDTIHSDSDNLATTAEVHRVFDHEINPYMLITERLGCADTLFDTIIFFHNPTLIISPDTIVCQGQMSHVRVSTPSEGCTFQWYRHKNRAGESPIEEGDILRTRISKAHETFYVKITSPSGCSAWDSVTLSLISVKVKSQPANGRFCPGDTIALTASGAVTYHWESEPADPTLDGQEGNATIYVSPQQSTLYRVYGFASDSCETSPASITSIPVEYPVPAVGYSPSVIDADDPAVTFYDLSQYRHHTRWLFPDGATASGQQASHRFNLTGDSIMNITMESFNQLNCMRDTTFQLPVTRISLWTPNVFTPNLPDNNVFQVIAINSVDEFHICIYDRRGDLVFESDDLHFTWDGTRNGIPLPQGAYVYMIRYKTPGTDNVYYKTRTLTLLR